MGMNLLFSTIFVIHTKCGFGQSHSIFFMDIHRTNSFFNGRTHIFLQFQLWIRNFIMFLTSKLSDVKRNEIFLISIEKHWFSIFLKVDINTILFYPLITFFQWQVFLGQSINSCNFSYENFHSKNYNQLLKLNNSVI